MTNDNAWHSLFWCGFVPWFYIWAYIFMYTTVVNFDGPYLSPYVTTPLFSFVIWKFHPSLIPHEKILKFDGGENSLWIFKVWEKKSGFFWHIFKIFLFFKKLFVPSYRPIKDSQLLYKRPLSLIKYIVTMIYFPFSPFFEWQNFKKSLLSYG